ncbi:MAG: tetratricopeptide repeat protein [Bacteroidota bacterium]|nr:tetratricopeptide repeat protein [Bacteroidota bacterium]MDP4232417.1 tetratricopeptide repeat protein [Bacteroidota bacterium]MDP4241553.1 tetratricopeptide repeat protein [Bacteroidota bacterium]MDP4286297.1 tetratricopeptide repeat protein [Bacteroidota bacterium]
MRNAYKIFLFGILAASTLSLSACRPSRSSRGTAQRSRPAAPAASEQSAPSAKQVLNHADSALARVSQLANDDREAPREMPPPAEGFAAPRPPMSVAPRLPQPDATEYGLYEAALGAYNGARYDEALALFSRIVTTGRPPELVPNAYYWMGESLYAMGRYAESMPYFRYVVRVGPQYKREMSLYKLSRANLHLGNRQGANTWYERLRAEYPRSSHISTLRRLGAR